MTDAADDFDALFEEVSAQRASAPAAAAAAPVAADEDDMEALFDQVAAARPPDLVAAAAQDMEPWFDQGAAAPPPDVVAAAAPLAVPAAAANEDEAGEGNAADKPMFERLGGIVRLLHDSLRELGYDKALTEASSQI